MKYKSIQISLLIVSAIIFSAISASAQSLKQYEVDIPFNFQLGRTINDAGEYQVNLKDSTANATILTLKSSTGEEIYRKVVIRSGASTRKAKMRLVFDRFGRKFLLTQLVSRDFAFNTLTKRHRKGIVSEYGKSKYTVSISVE